MKKRKNPYEVSPKGKILSYNINYDVERFSFLSEDSSLFEVAVDKVNSILNGIVGAKEYEIDWDDVIDEFLEMGVGDVPHFAHQYVFSRFLIKGRSKEKETMQKMYLEIVDSINEEIEKGNLPASKKQS